MTTPAGPAITVTFNTGRQYTTEGQIITARAVLHQDGMAVTFTDYSRHISGRSTRRVSVTLGEWSRLANDPAIFARRVMRMYDAGRYEWSGEHLERAPSVLLVDA